MSTREAADFAVSVIKQLGKNGDQNCNELYMRMAIAIAPMSGCLSGQVGCILVLPRNPGIVIPSYNIPPPGKKSCKELGSCITRFDGEKHRCINTVHSEMVALQIATSAGYDTKDGIIYCTKLACHSCAKVLAQFGISNMYYIESNTSLGKYGTDIVPSITFHKVKKPQ